MFLFWMLTKTRPWHGHLHDWSWRKLFQFRSSVKFIHMLQLIRIWNTFTRLLPVLMCPTNQKHFMKHFFKLKPDFRGVIVRDLNWSASGFILRISEGSAEEAFPDFLVLILAILWRLEKVKIFMMKNSYTCTRSYW